MLSVSDWALIIAQFAVSRGSWGRMICAASTATCGTRPPRESDHEPDQVSYPKLHTAMWPGIIGTGSTGAELRIGLDAMLDLTAKAEVKGMRFDGVDSLSYDPHIDIDINNNGLKKLADEIHSKGFVVGLVAAPVWSSTGGGSTISSNEDRKRFVEAVRKIAVRDAHGWRDGRAAGVSTETHRGAVPC